MLLPQVDTEDGRSILGGSEGESSHEGPLEVEGAPLGSLVRSQEEAVELLSRGPGRTRLERRADRVEHAGLVRRVVLRTPAVDPYRGLLAELVVAVVRARDQRPHPGVPRGLRRRRDDRADRLSRAHARERHGEGGLVLELGLVHPHALELVAAHAPRLRAAPAEKHLVVAEVDPGVLPVTDAPHDTRVGEIREASSLLEDLLHLLFAEEREVRSQDQPLGRRAVLASRVLERPADQLQRADVALARAQATHDQVDP